LYEQQLSLYGVVKVKNPVVAFQEVNKLISKRWIQRIEQKTDLSGEVILKFKEPDENGA